MSRIIGVLIFILSFVWVAIGWIKNIMFLVGATSLEFTGEIIVRVVGIFIPLIGTIMGWFF